MRRSHRKPKTEISPEVREAVLRLKRYGRLQNEIAVRVGISQSSVSRIALEAKRGQA